MLTDKPVILGKRSHRLDVRVCRGFLRGKAARKRAGQELQTVPERLGVASLPRIDRDGARGVVKAVASRAFDQPIDVVEGFSLAQPGTHQGAELQGVRQVRVRVEGRIQVPERSMSVGVPD